MERCALSSNIFTRWLRPASVHNGAGKMMRPGRGVIVRPQARIDLRNDHLLVRRTQLVDLIRQQSGGVQAMGTNVDFLPAVPGNNW